MPEPVKIPWHDVCQYIIQRRDPETGLPRWITINEAEEIIWEVFGVEAKRSSIARWFQRNAKKYFLVRTVIEREKQVKAYKPLPTLIAKYQIGEFSEDSDDPSEYPPNIIEELE